MVTVTQSLSLCLDDQKNLLLAFKREFVSDPYGSVITVWWNRTGEDCCSWYGVECDVEGHVIGLQLHGEVISREINGSSALFNFTHLQRLTLAQNDFGASKLPNAIGKLTRLRYLNLSNSGFAGQVPLGLSSLTSLVSLDLSSTPLTIENPNLKMILQNVTRIKELNLDGVRISDPNGEWGYIISSSLPNLRVLSLRGCGLSGPIPSSLAQLHSLSVLQLDRNSFMQVPNFFANFSRLTVLTLSYCGLVGYFPDMIFQIPSLEYLDVSYNKNLVGTLPQFYPTGSVRAIVVGKTNFTGSLHLLITNNRMLSKIDLSMCQFTGALPLELATLTDLNYLDLSYNSFSGSLPSLIMLKNLTHVDLSFNNLVGSLSSINLHPNSNLKHLNLRNNELNGSIPQSLFVIPSLMNLILTYNNFSGPFDEFSVPDYSSLYLLDLGSNKLEGPIPESLFKLDSLRFIALDNNSFNGTIDLGKFQSLVVSLDLSDNNWSIDVKNVNSSVPVFYQLNTLRLESCNLYSFPDVRNQSQLRYLGLAHNNIMGKIPSWIWEVGSGKLEYLNLADNFLVDIQMPYNISPLLNSLDLHSNQIEGHLSHIPLSILYMDFSYNKLGSFSLSVPMENVTSNETAFLSLADNLLSGTVPTSLCGAKYLSVLDLSNNELSGNIPPCLFKSLEDLKALNLEENNITGNIPDTFSRNCSLEMLQLRKNKLAHNLPLSLANCKSLEVFNIGDNKIEDTFPCMLPSNLRVLVLRSNKFHGELRCPKGWPNLQILDIAHNNFSGYLSSTNSSEWRGTVYDSPGTARRIGIVFWSNVYYEHALKLTFKGQELELTKILTIYTSMDFSCNNFQGNVPDIVGGLKSLYVLNLSHNSLTGTIPKSFGGLTSLGSLDLSMNHLTGEIPKELARLTFLSVLNVSYNKLVGQIPQGPQIQTFPASFFQGNMGLCGFPLNRSCSNNNKNGTSHEAEVKLGKFVEIEGAYISAALGFLVGFGSIIWLLFGCDSIKLRFSKKAEQILKHMFMNQLGRMRGQKRRVHRNPVRRQ